MLNSVFFLDLASQKSIKPQLITKFEKIFSELPYDRLKAGETTGSIDKDSNGRSCLSTDCISRNGSEKIIAGRFLAWLILGQQKFSEGQLQYLASHFVKFVQNRGMLPLATPVVV